jgi:transcription antitermination factor NusG
VGENRTAELWDRPRIDRDGCGGSARNPAAWYVVATKPRCEEMARTRLTERGFGTYLPLTVEWPPPAVGRAIQPMFPGYLLVHAALPHDFYRVAWAPGVKAFVIFGEAPPPLDERCVEFLRAREGRDGVIRRADGVEAGTTVSVVQGPLRGVAAVVQRRVPARERVVVLLNLLQRETPVELPQRWVKRA